MGSQRPLLRGDRDRVGEVEGVTSSGGGRGETAYPPLLLLLLLPPPPHSLRDRPVLDGDARCVADDHLRRPPAARHLHRRRRRARRTSSVASPRRPECDETPVRPARSARASRTATERARRAGRAFAAGLSTILVKAIDVVPADGGPARRILQVG